MLLHGKHNPLLSDKLWLEYQDVLGREDVGAGIDLNQEQRLAALNDFAAVCQWIHISRLWRPNSPDEGDNHVMELTICGNAAALVTFNKRDFLAALFAPPGLLILFPGEFLKDYSL